MPCRGKRVRQLLTALQTQEDFWYSLPSGVDEEADPLNTSPDDMAAHIAGLAVQAIRAVVTDEEAISSETTGKR